MPTSLHALFHRMSINEARITLPCLHAGECQDQQSYMVMRDDRVYDSKKLNDDDMKVECDKERQIAVFEVFNTRNNLLEVLASGMVKLLGIVQIRIKRTGNTTRNTKQ